MRCKSCNKNVSKLYHGLCTSCLSLLAKDKNDAVEDMMNAVKQDADLLLNPERLDEPGGFAKMVQGGRSYKTATKAIDGGKVVKKTGTKSNTGDEVAIYAYITGDFSDKDKRAFKPTLKYFASKYAYNFKNTGYKICKSNQFGEDDRTGGMVVESKGGLTVFKPTEFYDPSNVKTDLYAKDNAENFEFDGLEDDSIELGVPVEE